jgi:hypothetical protein
MREDVRAARREGRIMSASAIAYGIGVAAFWVAQLAIMDPMSWGVPQILGFLPAGLIPAIAALVVYLVGLTSMIRIYRTSHLEPDVSSWRYSDV